MSDESKNQSKNHQAKTFGKYLKTMRQKLQETLGETSGAVEIDVEQLDRFERGSELPSEDILMLLISHFNLADDEAVELWELAGYDYDGNFNDARGRRDNDDSARQPMPNTPVMLLALDSRVLFTNGVDLSADDAGMVLNFMQNGHDDKGQNGQRYPVSRIGMSFEQAEKLVEIMQKALLHKKYMSGPRQLPPTANSDNNNGEQPLDDAA
jgi:transcriptional regulator with XRE-family HTH domain